MVDEATREDYPTVEERSTWRFLALPRRCGSCKVSFVCQKHIRFCPFCGKVLLGAGYAGLPLDTDPGWSPIMFSAWE